MKCVKIGELEPDGQRKYYFRVDVNRQPVTYEIRASTQYEAEDKLRAFPVSETMEELGVVGTGATVIVILGAFFYGLAYLARRATTGTGKGRPISRPTKPKKTPPKRAGRPVSAAPGGRGVVMNGSEVKEAASSVVNGAVARTTAAVAAVSRAMGSPFAGRAGDRGNVTSSMRAPTTGTWQPLTYHGERGQIVGDEPTKGLRVIVFSDSPVDQFKTLSRASTFEGGTLRDPVTVLAFPAAAAAVVRGLGAVEVYVGSSPSRQFDVVADNVDQAIAGVRSVLAKHL